MSWPVSCANQLKTSLSFAPSSHPRQPSPRGIADYPFLVFLENSFRFRLETYDFSKECFDETRDPDVHRTQFLLQHIVNVPAVFGGVREAARVAQLWGLLGGWCRTERRCGLGDSVVGLIPDKLAGLVIADCFQERKDSFNFQTIRVDYRIDS